MAYDYLDLLDEIQELNENILMKKIEKLLIMQIK